MGMSFEAILAYGYALGGPGEWQMQMPDGYAQDGEGEPWGEFDWYRDDDVIESTRNCLLAAVGFTETNWRSKGYSDRLNDAVNRGGVEFYEAGSSDYPTYAVYAIGSKSSIEWSAKVVTPTIPDGADERLTWALETLGIKPTQPKPGWVLGSYHSY
jgi:hypothetical protein